MVEATRLNFGLHIYKYVYSLYTSADDLNG